MHSKKKYNDDNRAIKRLRADDLRPEKAGRTHKTLSDVRKNRPQ